MFGELRARIAGLAENGTLSELEGLYRTAVERREVLPNGRLLSAVIPYWATGDRVPDDLEQMPQYLDPFARRFNEAPSPLTGAVYAQALLQLAGMERGAAWAHETEPSQWAGFAAALSTAQSVLDAANPHGEDHYFWLEVSSEIGQVTGMSDAAREALFERAWSLDRINISLFGGHMQSLLPRWSGRDGRYADLFARRVLELTGAELGCGGYLVAYSYWASYPSNPQVEFEEAVLDQSLMRQGYYDLLQRYPESLVMRNTLACTMSWMGDEDLVKQQFDSGLRLIDHDSWGGVTEFMSLDRAARAFTYAREVA
ncbi:hypothetical protein [Leucobacter salsicius]|uniref:hypothetical protein n=1 Tax=Leucobacter salsicius TaxID=664638 RepID=UPI0003496CF9|nr:hypothetical protein [Leucobacter salsicius]